MDTLSKPFFGNKWFTIVGNIVILVGSLALVKNVLKGTAQKGLG